MKMAWLTDIHLDFLEEAEVARFYESIRSENPDGVLVGGDIADASSFERVLREMALQTERPIWFVLGNHDFYGSEVLLHEVSRHPHRQVAVLCGHTHSAGECRPLPNLRVLTGAAVYANPAIQRPLLNL